MESGTIKELAKLGTACVEFVTRVAGEPLEQVGGLFADEVRRVRFKRQMKILNEARLYFEMRGIEPRKVSMKVLASILTEGALEEEEGMAKLWAGLLASAADPTSEFEVPVAFPKILSELSAGEAQILESLFIKLETTTDIPREAWDGYQVVPDLLLPGRSKKWYVIASENLVRLGLCRWEWSVEASRWDRARAGVVADNLHVTGLGVAFLVACHPGPSLPKAAPVAVQ